MNAPPERRGTASRIARIVRRTVVAAACAALALLAVELLLRTGLAHDPLTQRLAVARSGAPGAPRALLIGDSFLYRDGPLDTILTAALGRLGIDVVNVAVPGAGPLQYQAMLDSWGRRVHPSLVVLCLYAGNDITDLMYHPDYRAATVSRRLKAWLRPLLWRLHSFYLANTIRSRIIQRQRRAAALEAAPAGADTALVRLAREGRANPFLFAGTPEQRATFLDDNLLLARPESRAALNELRRILDRMQARTRELGATLLVAVFPDAVQVSARNAGLWRRAGYRVEDGLGEDPVLQRALAAWAAERGVRFVDLLPAFRARAADDLWRADDFHFNAAGNVLASGVLADSIAAAARR